MGLGMRLVFAFANVGESDEWKVIFDLGEWGKRAGRTSLGLGLRSLLIEEGGCKLRIQE